MHKFNQHIIHIKSESIVINSILLEFIIILHIKYVIVIETKMDKNDKHDDR